MFFVFTFGRLMKLLVGHIKDKNEEFTFSLHK